MRKLSVIIEWKNQDFAEDQRASAMIRELSVQWQAIINADGVDGEIFDHCCELLFVVDCEHARKHLTLLLSKCFGNDNTSFDLRIIDGPGLNYYQLKHHGAMAAVGDLLIFLDSDVIPEAGWMLALLRAALLPQVEMVCGNTYIEQEGLIGKTFAAFWFFPLRSESTRLEAGVQCHANNLICSAKFYHAHPFVETGGSNRGSLLVMRKQLAEQGILMYRCHGARVAHPAPSGFIHFVVRSIGRGRNMYFMARTPQSDPKGILVEMFLKVWSNFRQGLGRLMSNYQRVGLKRVQLPLAWGIVWAYYSLAGLGCLLTHLAPDYMKTHFQF